MADSLTTQLLLAVKAREAFRTDTDSVVSPKVSNVFPGSTQQSMKLRRAAYVAQKKKDEIKNEQEDSIEIADVQLPSLQSVLSSNAAEDTQPDPINTRVEGKLGEPSAKPSSIQEEYTLLVASIKKVKAQVDLLKLLLIRSKLLTMDSAASSVEAVRLEYLSSRLMRLRQLNVIPNNSDRKTEARESYVLWCTNQRNLAVRKAKLDTEDVRKRRLSSIPQHAASSGTSTPEPKKAKGIGNIFGSDDSVRHVKFHSIDTVDGGDRRGSFFTLPEASVLADPLSITGVSMSEIMTDAGDDIIRRYKIHLNFLRDQDGLHADESVPAVAANKSHQMNRDKQVEHGDKNFVVESSPLTRSCRSVSFFSSTRSENECTLSPDRLEMPLNRDFVSFNFDEDQSDHLPAPQQSVISCITADLSGDSAAQLSHLESPYDEDSATISNTPSAKLQKRFSMSSTKDNFTSFVETKSSSAIRTDVIVPTVYREVNDDGAPIHNSRVLKLAAILKTFSVSSSSGVLQFEKEIETRMRRCLSFSSDAVNSKFVPEDETSKANKGIDEFALRISEKEATITNTAEYMKKIGNGIAEGYFNQIKDAHQLVLQAQLTRLERLQSRFPSAPRNSSDSLNIEQDTNFSEGD